MREHHRVVLSQCASSFALVSELALVSVLALESAMAPALPQRCGLPAQPACLTSESVGDGQNLEQPPAASVPFRIRWPDSNTAHKKVSSRPCQAYKTFGQ